MKIWEWATKHKTPKLIFPWQNWSIYFFLSLQILFGQCILVDLLGMWESPRIAFTSRKKKPIITLGISVSIELVVIPSFIGDQNLDQSKKKRGLYSLFYFSFFSWIIFSVKRFFSLVYYVCEKSENEVRCGVTGQPRSSREKKWNIKRNKAGRPFRPFPNVQIMNGKKSEREREREKKREKGVQ